MGTFVGMMGCIYGREDADKLPCEYQISFPRVGSCVRAAPGFAVIRKNRHSSFAGIVD